MGTGPGGLIRGNESSVRLDWGAGVKIRRRSNRIPGFGLTLGYTVFYLSLIFILPVVTLMAKGFSLDWNRFWTIITAPRVLAAYRLSLETALCAALVNGAFGLLVAWVLVRYDFPGKRLMDALVDLPFAMPTAVAGIALTTLYSENGLLGKPLQALGIKVAFAPLGIVVALTFIGLPFVVRSVQPVLQNLDRESEEAAVSLGASSWQAFWRVSFPSLYPGWLTGMSLAFARGLGEYGSLAFISGNRPLQTEVIPLLIMAKLEQYQYEAATAIALVMLGISFLILLSVHGLQHWNQIRFGIGKE